MPTDTDDCWSAREWFPEGGSAMLDRRVEAFKGDYIHQFTLGASGKHRYHLCQSIYDRSQGGFKYAENSMNGFSLVTVTPEEFNVKYMGAYVTRNRTDFHQLFEVSVKQNPVSEELFIQ